MSELVTDEMIKAGVEAGFYAMVPSLVADRDRNIAPWVREMLTQIYLAMAAAAPIPPSPGELKAAEHAIAENWQAIHDQPSEIVELALLIASIERSAAFKEAVDR